MISACWISYIIVHIMTLTRGQTYTEMNHLLEHLFNVTKYKKILRPLENQTNRIKVNFTQYLKSVEHFDISTGEVLTAGFYEISWRDEYLNWDPHQYGGRETVQLPKDMFWKPEFELINGRVNGDSSVYSNGAFPAWVTYNGDVTLVLMGTYQTMCDIDTRLFPLDVHQCSFQYIVSNHGMKELIVDLPTQDIGTDDMKENGEWTVENTNIEVNVIKQNGNKRLSIQMVEVSFTLKRRSTFCFVNIYAPIVLMTSLNIATCYVRPDTGERLSFAVTLYLSLVFAATAAIDKTPSNSLKMPYMSYEILITNLINTIGVTWSIFIVHLASVKIVDEKKLPLFFLKLVERRRRMKQRTLRPNDKIKPGTENDIAVMSLDTEENKVIKPGNEEENEKFKNVISMDITGLELAEVVDIVYFWLVSLSIFFLHFVSLIFIILA